MKTFTHTRSTGLKLAYTIECTQNSYTIKLGDTTLHYSGPMIQTGEIDGMDGLYIQAVGKIESLTGMSEL